MELVITLDIVEDKKRQHIHQVLQKERPRLLGFIKKRIPSLADAEDILQDVFSNFVESFLLPEPIQQSTGWLYRVAKNKIADTFRKKSPENFSQLEPDEEHWLENLMINESSPEDYFWNQSLANALQEAIALLPKAQREVFIWHEIDGLTFKQIQAKLQVPIPTLISRKRYAVKSLQTLLMTMYQDFKEQ